MNRNETIENDENKMIIEEMENISVPFSIKIAPKSTNKKLSRKNINNRLESGINVIVKYVCLQRYTLKRKNELKQKTFKESRLE